MANLIFGAFVGYCIGSYFGIGYGKKEAYSIFRTYMSINHPKTFAKMIKEIEEM
jgi:hypothetical protein